MVVIEAVFLTILFSGLVSLNGTGFSPCSEPDAAATLCDAMVVLFAHGYFPTLCCAVWAQQLLLPGSLLAVLFAGKVLLLALHSLSHSVVEVVVARLDHLGYQLEEGVRSEVVVGMAILHGSLAHPVRLAVMVSRRPKVSSDHKIIYFEIETFLSRRSFSPGRIG